MLLLLRLRTLKSRRNWIRSSSLSNSSSSRRLMRRWRPRRLQTSAKAWFRWCLESRRSWRAGLRSSSDCNLRSSRHSWLRKNSKSKNWGRQRIRGREWSSKCSLSRASSRRSYPSNSQKWRAMMLKVHKLQDKKWGQSIIINNNKSPCSSNIWTKRRKLWGKRRIWSARCIKSKPNWRLKSSNCKTSLSQYRSHLANYLILNPLKQNLSNWRSIHCSSY